MSTVSQRAFSAGELDPALHARVDFNKYYTGLKKLKNFIVKKQGGVENRAGTQFVDGAGVNTGNVRLIGFDAGADARYAVELYNLKARIIKNGAYITNATTTVTAVSLANPAVVTYSGADVLTAGEFWIASGFAGDIGKYLNGRQFKIGTVNTGANTFQLLDRDGLGVNSATWPAYTSGGTFDRIMEIVSPYAGADLFDLQYSQSVDEMTFTHPSYPINRLLRENETTWGFVEFIESSEGEGSLFSLPSISTIGTAGTTTYEYKIGVVDRFGVEYHNEVSGFYFRAITTGNATLSATNAVKIDINLTSGNVLQYNYYRKEINGTQYGFIGSSSTKVFIDVGYTPDFTKDVPTDTFPIFTSDNYPSANNYVQQRRVVANTNTNKESVWMSRIGNFNDFRTGGYSDDQPIEFRISGKKYNPIRHIVDIGAMVLLTESSEVVVNGDGSAITPTNISVKAQTYNGSARLSPIVINDNALYVQANKKTIRDLLFDYQIDGFTGNDLGLFAQHLFDGYEIVDWCFQKTPDSIIWIVRDDGKVLSLTYLREQQVLAFAQHELAGGLVESCCAVYDDNINEDTVYFVVKRGTQKYIEKLTERLVLEEKQRSVYVDGETDIVTYSSINECKIVDSCLSYDGRFSTDVRVIVTEITGWGTDDTVNIEISGDTFSAADVGNQIHLYLADGSALKISIIEYTDASNVVGRPVNRAVPDELKDIETSNGGKAVDVVTGLWHLEGEYVSILADGYVKASVNNEDYEQVLVASGSVFLNDCYVVIHVGLPIRSEMQTLNIDTVNGETLVDKKLNIQKVTFFLNKTRGLFVGQNENSELQELRPRNTEGYNVPARLIKGAADVIIESRWESTGSVYVRQDDPLPANILSVNVSGYIPTR